MASMSPMGSVSSFGGSVSSKEMKARERRRKEELRAKLSGLPTPQYEYELVAPEVSTCVVTAVVSYVRLAPRRGTCAHTTYEKFLS